MKFSRVCVTLAVVGLVAFSVAAQTESQVRRAGQGKTSSADEVVSFKSDVPYADAIKSLGELWKKFTGKIVIDRSPMKGVDKTIGINIQVMYWKDAFELLLRQNQLWYNEYDEHVEIVSTADVGRPAQADSRTVQDSKAGVTPPTSSGAPPSDLGSQVARVDSAEIYATKREVTISSVFFEVNRTKLSESGINFSLFRGRGLNLGVEFTGADKVSTPLFKAQVAPNDSRLAVDVNAALALFESEQYGEVIARPQITVRSEGVGRLQSGQNFFIAQRDFSGNIVQVPVETGTILTVSPKVFTYNDMPFVTLAYKIERSTPLPGGNNQVNKTEAVGTLQLLDKEEAYVGGLYSTDVTTTREGVPVLKDLPWWVFGLRYIFGYNQDNVTKKELIVLIKADILPLLQDRKPEKNANRNMLQERLNEQRQDETKRTPKRQ